jgi:hypothetical protein
MVFLTWDEIACGRPELEFSVLQRRYRQCLRGIVNNVAPVIVDVILPCLNEAPALPWMQPVEVAERPRTRSE